MLLGVLALINTAEMALAIWLIMSPYAFGYSTDGVLPDRDLARHGQ